MTKHNLEEAKDLLNILPLDKTLDPCSLFRFIMILIGSSPPDNIHKNVIFHLESLMSKLNLYPTEVLFEILNYLVRNNRLSDARELFSGRHRSITRKSIKILPCIDENIHCIEFLLNYLMWQQQVDNEDIKPVCSVSTQGWIVNAVVHLQSMNGNYEYFVMALTRMLLFYNYYKKAYLFVSEVMRRNPNNISAQLLLLNLSSYLRQSTQKQDEIYDDNTMDCSATEQELEKNRTCSLEKINNFSKDLAEEQIDLSQYPILHDEKTALENLRKLDASQTILVKNSEKRYSVNRLEDILDGLEYVQEIQSKNRWKRLRQALDDLFMHADIEAINEAKVLWQTKYRPYWTDVDFVELAGQDLSRSRKRLIKEVSESLRTRLDN